MESKKDLVTALLDQAEWASKMHKDNLATCWNILVRNAEQGLPYDKLHAIVIENREWFKSTRYYIDDYDDWDYISHWFDEHAEWVPGWVQCRGCGNVIELGDDEPSGEPCEKCGEPQHYWFKTYSIYDGR